MTRLRHVIRLRDWPRLAWWLRFRPERPITVALSGGMRAVLRPAPSLDFMIFYEVFVNRVYNPPWPDVPPVRRVVDVGGYVGYSCLFWRQRFPDCSITVYEPMPEHVEAIREHLSMNSLPDVAVRPVAAGVRPTSLFLTRHSAASRLTNDPRDGAPVEVVDLFAEAGGPVDLLKLDCEGGERELLADPRFAELAPRLLVMECHDDESRASPTEAVRLTKVLEQLGYETHRDEALVWARRQGR